MSSLQCLRELMNQRLTAAAEEIFAVFQKTIVEFEEEIDRQRRLLDVVWKPEIRLHRAEPLQQHVGKEQEVLPEQQGFQKDVGWKPDINVHRIELPQQHVCKQEEFPADQQLCNQDQEDPDPPRIKEEQEELFSSLELVPRQETETFLSTPTCEESEDQTLDLSLRGARRAAEKEHVVDISVEPEPNGEDRLFSRIAESRDHRGSKTKPQKRHNKSKNLTDNRDDSAAASLKIHSSTNSRRSGSHARPRIHTAEKPYVCNTCEKRFSSTSALNTHLAIHRDEKQHSCKTCGKSFRFSNGLSVHMRIHTGEKPYLCNTCGKNFRHVQALKEHIRIHTGERPYSCNTCGNNFRHLSGLKNHVRIHTGEKLCPCKICGKTLRSSSGMSYHMRTHAAERPYLCNTCGKRYSQMVDLKAHTRTHTGEKPFNCALCVRTFRLPGNLMVHMRRVHNSEKTFVPSVDRSPSGSL